MNRKWKLAARMLRHHGKIMEKGLCNMLFGTATAGLFAMAIYGFTAIPAEGGYTAVADFVLSMMTLALAVSCVHGLGGGRRRR